MNWLLAERHKQYSGHREGILSLSGSLSMPLPLSLASYPLLSLAISLPFLLSLSLTIPPALSLSASPALSLAILLSLSFSLSPLSVFSLYSLSLVYGEGVWKVVVVALLCRVTGLALDRSLSLVTNSPGAAPLRQEPAKHQNQNHHVKETLRPRSCQPY